MPNRISFALAIHNHQPVGNFGWVLAEVFDLAYAPLVNALERSPSVRVSLHYTGPLLEWLRAERPAFVERLRDLVNSGQVEILGGGWAEPVLASLPERDRVGQLMRMGDELEMLFGRRPRGAWLAERVWEPSLPTSLRDAGYDWTILDDAHFRAASIPEEQRWGAYVTEDQGALVTLFGTEQGLRYLIPFGTVEDVIAHLRANATEDGTRLGMMGDDGEKFGAWPTTFEHCWGKGRWMERFFEALEENADWLQTVHPSAWLAEHPPIGRAYVPTGSYAEMGEWSLPPDESRAYSAALHHATDRDLPERRWLRGGFWRNFQVKYREINDLHKQMLRTSAKVDAMPEGAAKTRALDHLYRGQSNDCYWHGLFGGIYISHMRLATFEHLIAAEDLADSAAAIGPVGTAVDTDLDGIDEALLAGHGQTVVVDLAEGGAIGSWDIRAVRHALAAVLRRRPEAAHTMLLEHATVATGGRAERHDVDPRADPGQGAGACRPAPVRRIRAAIRSRPLPRTGCDARHVGRREHARAGRFPGRAVRAGRPRRGGPGGSARRLGRRRRWRQTPGPGRQGVHGRRRPAVTPARARGGRREPVRSSLTTRIGIEWNLTMLGGGGNPAAWYEVAGERTPHDGSGAIDGVTAVRQGNDHVGVTVDTSVEPAADAWWAPIDTISNSENGFERVYQGSALLLSWPLTLGPGQRHAFRVEHAVSTARDRALEEVA